MASSYLHIEFHSVLYFWIIYSLAILMHKVDRKSGFKTADQRSAIHRVITGNSLAYSLYACILLAHVRSCDFWHLHSIHLSHLCLVFDNSCGFLWFILTIQSQNSNFYANCRFSAVNGLISIFYIASQNKSYRFQIPFIKPVQRNVYNPWKTIIWF